MDSNSGDGVQYDRWNEDNINMNVEASQPTMMRHYSHATEEQTIYNRVCIGSTGIAVRTAGALAALVSIYIIGYLTGYYIHKC